MVEKERGGDGRPSFSSLSTDVTVKPDAILAVAGKNGDFPPLDFRAAGFIYLPLLILNQRDRCKAQLWRVAAAAIAPTPMWANPTFFTT